MNIKNIELKSLQIDGQSLNFRHASLVVTEDSGWKSWQLNVSGSHAPIDFEKDGAFFIECSDSNEKNYNGQANPTSQIIGGHGYDITFKGTGPLAGL